MMPSQISEAWQSVKNYLGFPCKPRRIQRKRLKGWRMPANTVYVGRPTIWGNIFPHNGSSDVVARYRDWITAPGNEIIRFKVKQELRGKNLACWCALDRPCHADVLLKIANEDSTHDAS